MSQNSKQVLKILQNSSSSWRLKQSSLMRSSAEPESLLTILWLTLLGPKKKHLTMGSSFSNRVTWLSLLFVFSKIIQA